MSDREMKLRWLDIGRLSIAWKRANDGEWAINNKVVRARIKIISDGESRALNIILFSFSFYFAWAEQK